MELKDFASASMTGARAVRVINMTDGDIAHRAREGTIFAHPGLPRLVKRMIRRGRLDWALAGARQALRDIEKPIDYLTHEARAAWVIQRFLPQLQDMTEEERELVCSVAVTAIRCGVRD